MEGVEHGEAFVDEVIGLEDNIFVEFGLRDLQDVKDRSSPIDAVAISEEEEFDEGSRGRW